MFTALKPYPAYRDSDTDWMASVPAHWDVRRMRYLLREVDHRSTSGAEQLLRVSQYTGVTERKSGGREDAPDTRAASLVGYKRVCPEDLVINIMLAWNGSLGSSRYEGIVSPAYCVYHFVPGSCATFYHHLLRSPAYRARIKAMSTGVVESRLRLYSDQLYRIEGLAPPADEQTAIVKYLGHANARIDRTIAAKRMLIALLEEQKQAIIKQAVTRGLDRTVPLKDSGVPWLGQIPADWTTKRFGNVATARSVPGTASLGLLSVYLGRGVIPYSEGGKRVHAPSLDLSNYQEVRPGEFVMNNQQAWRGSVGVSSLHGIVSPAYHVYELASGLTTSFASHLLTSPSMVAQYVVASKGVGDIQRQLHVPYLRMLTVPIPPHSEQRTIAAYLDSQSVASDSAISHVRREIELLREFQTRLTADVVTGQLDVRDAASRLPKLDFAGLVDVVGSDEDDLGEESLEYLDEADA